MRAHTHKWREPMCCLMLGNRQNSFEPKGRYFLFVFPLKRGKRKVKKNEKKRGEEEEGPHQRLFVCVYCFSLSSLSLSPTPSNVLSALWLSNFSPSFIGEASGHFFFFFFFFFFFSFFFSLSLFLFQQSVCVRIPFFTFTFISFAWRVKTHLNNR